MAQPKKLVIVESPTKARKIGGYLGDGYKVMASVGHVRDIPGHVPAKDRAKYGEFGVDVNHGFEPLYAVPTEKKHTVTELKDALKGADELYLATDEDREGEAIAWHLVQTLKPKVPVKRMVFHEITNKAIHDSLGRTREVDAHMVEAQETRRILDRLYGYELSPVLWRKVRRGLSAGRVQSVATRLIVERERERMAFVRRSYWDLTATLVAASEAAASEAAGAASDGAASAAKPFDARMVSLGGRRLAGSKDFGDDGKFTAAAAKEQPVVLDQGKAHVLAGELSAATFTVDSLDTKPYTRRPQPPFTTSTLQQVAGNRLGFSSRRTMSAAQGLYENGYITYMRTDSVVLSGEAINAARTFVEQEFGDRYLSPKPRQFTTKTAGAQEAHEAIRPAGARFRTPGELAGKVNPDQHKLYTLIWQRTVATQMADALGQTATVRISAPTAGDGAAVFQASGTVITFPGFTKVFGAGFKRVATDASARDASSRKGDDVGVGRELPPMRPGQTLDATAVEPAGHETQPPARYTEATLVKTLEAKEIGRPSTYASIISTIIDRGYVYEKGRALIPSWLAFSVTKLLETKFPSLVDYAFTAQMEEGLDRIARGEESGKDWLTRFYFGEGPDSAHTEDEAREGLRRQVEHLGEIDAHAINATPIGDGINVYPGRYSPYIEDTKNLDANGNPARASVPDGLAPDELTVEVARHAIAEAQAWPRVLGDDPDTGFRVEVREGRFGPYIAMIDPNAKEGERPAKMTSLFKTMDPHTVGLDDALRLLRLPREVGVLEETNAETGEVSQSVITAANGRYGPYLTKKAADGKTETRSLPSEDAIFTVTVPEAKALFDQPKYGPGRGRGAAKPPLRELGTDPVSGKPVTIKEGRFGPYITDGETNKSLPRQYAPESITPEDAYRILAEKRAAGPAPKRGRGRAGSGASKASASKSRTSSSKASKAKGAAKGAKSSYAAEQEKKRADRRAKVRELADQGWANTRIAKEIGSTPATVKSDVAWLEANESYTRPAVVPAAPASR